MKRNLFLFIAVLAISLNLDYAAAQSPVPVFTNFGHITGLETGWRDDTMSVSLDVPFVNSHDDENNVTGQSVIKPCQVVHAGYALDPKDPGVKVHQAVLLSAFLATRKVRVLVQGCIFNKPRIIAVGIGDPLN